MRVWQWKTMPFGKCSLRTTYSLRHCYIRQQRGDRFALLEIQILIDLKFCIDALLQ